MPRPPLDLDTPITVVDAPPPADSVDTDDIPTMCADLLDSGDCSDNFAEFVSSLHDWYDEHGWLTRNQYDALDNAWHKMRGSS